jgi:hypothetical protein
MDREFSTNRGEKKCIWDIVGKPEERRPLGRPRRRWVDKIKIDLRETGRDAINWIDLV